MSSPGGSPDVLVLGGGILGLACARELAGAGRSVHLLDARAEADASSEPDEERSRQSGDPFAGASSLAAAGMLSLLLDAPQLGEETRVYQAARDLWAPWAEELTDETGASLGFDTSGALALALDEAEEGRLDALGRAAARIGERTEEVPVDDARKLLEGVTPELRRALRLTGEHRVHNVRTVAALITACRRRGVVFHWESRVTEARPAAPGESAGVSLRTARGDEHRGAALVLAAGCWSGGIAGLHPLPIRPVRGQMLRFDGVPWSWRGSVRTQGLYALPRGDGALLVGSTLEEVGYQPTTTDFARARLSGFARRLVPDLARVRPTVAWAGLRPATPDSLPLIGPTGEPGVYAATGHYRDGILLAPWTARELRRSMDGATPASLRPFRPDRFRLTRGLPANHLV